MALTRNPWANTTLEADTGWTKSPAPYDLISVEAEFEVYKEYNAPMEYIKHSLVNEIAEKIFNQNLVEIQKVAKMDPLNDTDTYKARLKIPNQQMSNIIMDSEHFMWQGKRWTQDELIKALEKAYPQYMI